MALLLGPGPAPSRSHAAPWVLATGSVLLLALLVPVLVIGGAPDGAGGQCVPPSGAGGSAVTVNTAGLPATVGRFTGEQVPNAAAVLAAGQALGVDLRAQTIAIMTALGEDDLVNTDHGDAVGPDSRGIFQQRAEGWGSYADRMTPVIAAGNFYRALLAVPAWETVSPTLAAHAVQRNQDPDYYTGFWTEAVGLVSALSGIPDLAAKLPAGGGIACAPGASGGFALPLPRAVLNLDVVRKAHHDHAGADLPAPTGTPITAVEGGTVTVAGPVSGFGNHFVAIIDAAGWTWFYGHGSAHDVSVGQTVAAGQVIAAVGNEGFSTGPHLHLGLDAPGQSVPTLTPSSCPQDLLAALWNAQPPPALAGLSTSACIGAHLAGF